MGSEDGRVPGQEKAAEESVRLSADARLQRLEHARRLQAVDQFIASYEADHGVITDEEIAEVQRSVRSKAIVIRSGRVIHPVTDRAR